MRIPTRELTPDDRELIEFARRVVDDYTDGEDGVHTMGAAVRGADGLAAIVAVGNNGRGPVGPCGRDRQILFDYHPGIQVILPTEQGVRSVRIEDLMPLGAVWTVTGGTQEFDPAVFKDRAGRG
jgi:hypothetical protein